MFIGNILIIDKDDSFRYFVNTVLSGARYQVSMAENATQGLALARLHGFNVIFCELSFASESHDLALIATLRRETSSSRIIMITTNPSEDIVLKAIRYGASDYLVKPIMPNDLLRCIKRTLDDNKHQEKDKFFKIGRAILSIDIDFNLFLINNAAKHMCGFTHDSLGKKFPEESPHCAMACHTAVTHSVKIGKHETIHSIHCQKKADPQQTVMITLSPLYTHKEAVQGIIMLVENILPSSIPDRNKGFAQKTRTLVGYGPAMQAIYTNIDRLARVKTTTLITGESGTGKELVVEAIHHQGDMFFGERPLVKVNCAALSETLLESELFGHVRGAFTGATNTRRGRFEMADGGTLFLDEIGDISQSIQARLLRVLQEQQFERVGDSKTMQVNVRIIAATNKDLRSLVSMGSFREDLYYRLKVFELRTPPLRERREDIPLLCSYFIEKFNMLFNANISGISEKVMGIWMNNNWEGNVRELEHTIERSFVICREPVIDLQHLPTPNMHFSAGTEESENPQLQRNNQEKEAIIQTLISVHWNRGEAIKKMGMSRATFYRRLNKYGILNK